MWSMKMIFFVRTQKVVEIKMSHDDRLERFLLWLANFNVKCVSRLILLKLMFPTNHNLHHETFYVDGKRIQLPIAMTSAGGKSENSNKL